MWSSSASTRCSASSTPELEREGLLNKLGAGIVVTGGASTLYGTVELAQQVFAARYAAAFRAKACRDCPTPLEGQSSRRLQDSLCMAQTGTKKLGWRLDAHIRPGVQGRIVAEGILLKAVEEAVPRRTNDWGHRA